MRKTLFFDEDGTLSGRYIFNTKSAWDVDQLLSLYHEPGTHIDTYDEDEVVLIVSNPLDME